MESRTQDVGSVMQAMIEQVRSRLTVRRSQPRTLLAYADLSLCEDFTQEYASRSVTAVPISRIQGSLNRTNDFDADFRPLTTHTSARLKGIIQHMRAGRSLPPIELVQINDIYYVRDGHHRIAAA